MGAPAGACEAATSGILLTRAEAEQREGREALRQGDCERAVQLLGSSLEKMVQVHGDLAPECAFSYFKYGTALFYKSQEEAQVLGSAAGAKAAAGASAAPRSGIKIVEPKNKPAEAGHTSAVGCNNERADFAEDRKGKGPARDEPATITQQEEEEDLDEEDEEGKGEGAEVDLEEEGGGEEEEDESDLALAWQVLETARCIYEKLPERTVDEADVIMLLADISLEKEDFSSCIADYGRALGLLHAILSPGSRTIAEAYFRLCLAHETAQQPLEALECCRKAIGACSLCLADLRAKLAAAEGGSDAPENAMAGAHGEGGEATAQGSAAGNSAASASAVSGPAQKEAIEKEIADVEAVVVDLKEKEAEIQECLKHPSLRHLLAQTEKKAAGSFSSGRGQDSSVHGQASSALGQASSASGQQCSSGHALNSRATLLSSMPSKFPGGTAMKDENCDNGAKAEQPVAIVGRGKKRVAPTPVEPSGEGKKLC